MSLQIEAIGKNNLKIKNLRKIIKSPDQEYLVEGFNLVEEAFKSGVLIEIYVDNENYFEIKQRFRNIKITLIKKEVTSKLTSVCNGPAIFGLCTKNREEKIDYTKPIVVLENIQDPGNLGMIIRTLAAFNFKNLILSNCVNPYNQKVLRSAMGGHFYLNIVKLNLDQVISNLKTNEYQLIGLSLQGRVIKDFEFTPKQAFFFGNEGKGLTQKLQTQMDENLLIPIKNVESLNVGVTVALIVSQSH